VVEVKVAIEPENSFGKEASVRQQRRSGRDFSGRPNTLSAQGGLAMRHRHTDAALCAISGTAQIRVPTRSCHELSCGTESNCSITTSTPIPQLGQSR
jgi:hypothetical protein